MTSDHRILAKLSAALLLGVTLAGAPALADKGGNGGHGGNGGGGSGQGSSHGNAGNSDHGKSGSHAKATDDTDTEDEADDNASTTGKAAREAGRLNGFLHASPNAIAKASPNSSLGMVRDGYGALLGSYLGTGSADKPTAAELAAALEAVSNKPLTADVIARVNAKLIASDADLQADLAASGKTADQLAEEISAAL